MLLIPEIKTVIILVPKNASVSITNVIKKKYRDVIFLYRHIVAVGVLFGYDSWKKVGVIRGPFERLWNLYNSIKYNKGYLSTFKKSVDASFNNSVTGNTAIFTRLSNPINNNWCNPRYTANYLLPETRKNQIILLRPDLSTALYRLDFLEQLEADLDIKLKPSDALTAEPVLRLVPKTIAHIKRYFEWDLNFYGGENIHMSTLRKV